MFTKKNVLIQKVNVAHRKMLVALGGLRQARKVACRPGATDDQFWDWYEKDELLANAKAEYELAQDELRIHLRKRARHRRR